MRLDELAKKIEATVVGDGSIEITSVAPLEAAGAGQISFFGHPRYTEEFEATRASAVIVSKKIESSHVPLLRTADPYFALQQAVVILHGYRKHPHEGVHSKAHVEPTAKLGPGCVVYPGAYIGPRVTMGRDCIIYPNVVIYDDTTLGDRVIIHAGTAVGVDGFGYAPHNGVHHKIPQVGRVIIEDDVEIGPNGSIERGALDDTRIGKGSKFDGLVVFGHGSTIGPHGILVAQTGVSGSVTMGHHVVLGGQCGVAGHLKIGDMVQAAGQSGIISDIESNSTLMGAPAMPISHARRVYTLLTKLPELVGRLRDVEGRVEKLDK